MRAMLNIYLTLVFKYSAGDATRRAHLPFTPSITNMSTFQRPVLSREMDEQLRQVVAAVVAATSRAHDGDVTYSDTDRTKDDWNSEQDSEPYHDSPCSTESDIGQNWHKHHTEARELATDRAMENYTSEDDGTSQRPEAHTGHVRQLTTADDSSESRIEIWRRTVEFPTRSAPTFPYPPPCSHDSESQQRLRRRRRLPLPLPRTGHYHGSDPVWYQISPRTSRDNMFAVHNTICTSMEDYTSSTPALGRINNEPWASTLLQSADLREESLRLWRWYQ
ncbi:hypothetical protein AC578_7762 [Pseudocercospora eumusae]|uniref:Uncharacterized protein n=1 Tax=Pseudocercospora eumusae TaxID=321146 RepID=A0A139H150_9PEZI|nr:hypothetical protein AC578_7762 [Pseudocercospora eumusae]